VFVNALFPLSLKTLTSAECAVPNKLRSHTKCARYAEEDSVVLHLRETIVCKERARVRIHVWPRVLRLASLPITREWKLNRSPREHTP
jgi:hypothetical protein